MTGSAESALYMNIGTCTWVWSHAHGHMHMDMVTRTWTWSHAHGHGHTHMDMVTCTWTESNIWIYTCTVCCRNNIVVNKISMCSHVWSYDIVWSYVWSGIDIVTLVIGASCANRVTHLTLPGLTGDLSCSAETGRALEGEFAGDGEEGCAETDTGGGLCSELSLSRFLRCLFQGGVSWRWRRQYGTTQRIAPGGYGDTQYTTPSGYGDKVDHTMHSSWWIWGQGIHNS